MSENDEKLRVIRGHLSHGHRLNLTEARWLVDQVLETRRRADHAIAAAEGMTVRLNALGPRVASSAKRYFEGYDDGTRDAIKADLNLEYEYAADDSPDGTIHGYARRLVGPW